MLQKGAALAPNFLRGLYLRHEIEPLYCAMCRKSEQWEKPFPECSGCNLVIYCSRECQKSDWKNHKRLCLDAQKFGKKELNKVGRRMIKFHVFYAPLLDLIVLFRYALYNIATKGRGRPKNHIVEIRLCSLPDSMRRPRLGIEKILIREMSTEERAKVEATARKETYFLPYVCYLQVSNFKSYQSMHGNTDMMETVQNISKEDLLQRVTASVQTINVIANGLRPDLFKIIADCMK
ncbi:hypothetical protein QTG54_004661 [Skeletonema marinoi]|uniref:MYND-type domain-containing protein n=1 Tax=Skeletonema marinoi TaxID=267567 RepID=A0AAD8XSA2_9STRA|nr:hypothetical protein QTG54_016884 [Skeletonema marinoi]KAK1744128.1 hypothetical protein QTG54_004661 [Skeletonema marinoi]